MNKNDNPSNNETNDDELDQVTLYLEDDSELLCDVISVFECNGRSYISLLPVDDPDGDFIFYRYSEKENGEVELDDIDSDDEFEDVADAFDEIYDDAEWQEAFDSLDDEEE